MLQKIVGVMSAAMLALSVLGTPLSAATGGWRGTTADLRNQTFTASNGLSSRYHLYDSGVPTDRALGLLVHFHGDGAYEFNNPDSSYALGGSTGIVAKAKEHGMLVIAALSPDREGTVTWWEQGGANADYVRDLIQAAAFNRYNIDTSNIWLVGYSGGAQFVTQFFLPKHSALIRGGGSIVFGGGGAPRVTPVPFGEPLKANLRMHWYTGANDTGTSPEWYDALNGYSHGAKAGEAWYAERGFRTSHEYPAGVGHDLSGRFGPVVGQQLALAAAARQPVPFTYTATRTTKGMIVQAVIPTSGRVTLRASKAPLTGQVGWWRQETSDVSGRVRVELSKFQPGVPYYWQLEASDGSVMVQGLVPGAPA